MNFWAESQDPLTSPQRLHELATKYGMARQVSEHPAVSKATLQFLLQDANTGVRISAAAHSTWSPLELKQLATSDDTFIVVGVANNPSTPSDVLEALATDADWRIRRATAENPNLSPALLEQLAADRETDVRSHVARNPSSPTELLELLATDKESFVQMGVAGNPRTPSAQLESLSKSAASAVRIRVAANPSTPEHVLVQQESDEDAKVRESVAMSPRLPHDLLLTLTEDHVEEVRVKARMSAGVVLRWPEDVNDYLQWPEDLDLDQLLDHMNGLTLETFKKVLIEDYLDSNGAVMVATQAASAALDPLTRLLWLQQPLYYSNLWPTYGGDGFFEDYLNLMWTIIRESQILQADTVEASRTLDALMTDMLIWRQAVAPAAILAQCSVSGESVDAILRSFTSSWSKAKSGYLHFTSSTRIGLGAHSASAAAPLLAIACLNPAATVDLAAETALKCSVGDVGSAELRVAFWQYISGCLIADRTTTDWWCPDVTWRDGFFANGLPQDCPAVGTEQLSAITACFLDIYKDLDWSDLYREEHTLETVLTVLAARSDIPDALLARLASAPFSSTRATVSGNPSASNTTRALAAIRTDSEP